MALRIMEEQEREVVENQLAEIEKLDKEIMILEHAFGKIKDKHSPSAIKGRCRTKLDVWASVEVCRAHADPTKCPSIEDALGVYSDEKDFAEYILGKVYILREQAFKKAKKNRPTDWDAKMRSAIIDTLLKLMKPDFDFHAAAKGIRPSACLRDIVNRDGFDPVMEVWDETERAMQDSPIIDVEQSVLVLYPRSGKWSGMAADRKKWQKYQQESRHVRKVNAFLDWWVLNLTGTKVSE